MQQVFDNRKYSTRDFEEWNEKGSLFLQPKFQRREVWSDSAKAFLVDTIIRGKPIPKIYMRLQIDPSTRATRRELVDGQQRIKTVLDFLSDAIKIRKSHNREFGGRYFSGLDQETQKSILAYEFSVDLLRDVPDSEIYDIFARLNTYSMKLKDQELRNASFHGEFKSLVYSLANEFTTFWTSNEIFSSRQMLRMDECEFASELLIAMMNGITEKSKARIDRQYKDFDAEGSIPNIDDLEQQFRTTIDTVGAIFQDRLCNSGFRATRLLYPLFCTIYHANFGLKNIELARPKLKPSRYSRVRTELEGIDSLLADLKDQGNTAEGRSGDIAEFYAAYSEHWVHAEERRTLFKYINKKVRLASEV